MNVIFLVFGAVFGFILSRARATDYNTIVNMFRMTDLYLMGVMAVGIAVAAIGIQVLRRTHAKALMKCPIEIHAKPSHRWMLVAGIVFGAGWALAGA